MPDPSQVDVLVNRMKPILAGHDPAIQGAVLANLLALLLAGHMGDNKRAVRKAREEILRLHIDTVRKLVPICEKEIMANIEPAGRG